MTVATSPLADTLADRVRHEVRLQHIDPKSNAAAVESIAVRVIQDHEGRSLTGAVQALEDPDMLVSRPVADVDGRF